MFVLHCLLFVIFVVFTVTAVSENIKRLTRDTRIVGGFQIQIKEAPYQVSVQRGIYHVCGGCLISDTWILTAAHCTLTYTFRDYKIRVGSSSISIGGLLIPAKSIIQHQSYSVFTLEYDFSLIELSSSALESGIAVPIALPQQNEIFPDGSLCFVTGWGSTNIESDPPAVLRGVYIPTVSNEKCNQSYRNMYRITSTMICAGYDEGGKDTCKADSGGPLNLNGVLIGVVSFGYQCGTPNYPGVYARVAQVRNWIRRNSGV